MPGLVEQQLMAQNGLGQQQPQPQQQGIPAQNNQTNGHTILEPEQLEQIERFYADGHDTKTRDRLQIEFTSRRLREGASLQDVASELGDMAYRASRRPNFTYYPDNNLDYADFNSEVEAQAFSQANDGRLPITVNDQLWPGWDQGRRQ